MCEFCVPDKRDPGFKGCRDSVGGQRAKVYDVWPESGERIVLPNGERVGSVRLVGYGGVGCDTHKSLASLESKYGPLFVKSTDGLDKFIDGHLKVGTYEAIANAVAEVTK